MRLSGVPGVVVCAASAWLQQLQALHARTTAAPSSCVESCGRGEMCSWLAVGQQAATLSPASCRHLVCMSLQVQQGAELLSERTATEDKKLNKVRGAAVPPVSSARHVVC